MADVFLSYKKFVDKLSNKCPYYIGDIYPSTSDISPSVKWPGTTWQRLDGYYLYSPKVILTGTTWRFNDALPIEVFPHETYVTSIVYHITFTDLAGGNYTALKISGSDRGGTKYARYLDYGGSFGDTEAYLDNAKHPHNWYNTNYKTITLTGGTDIASAELYAFLTKTAVLVGAAVYDYPLGSTIEAGLPNITGVGHYGDNNNEFSGALYNVKSANYIGDGSASGTLIGLDASRSNPIYGNSDTVRPRSYVVNMWLRTA